MLEFWEADIEMQNRDTGEVRVQGMVTSVAYGLDKSVPYELHKVAVFEVQVEGDDVNKAIEALKTHSAVVQVVFDGRRYADADQADRRH